MTIWKQDIGKPEGFGRRINRLRSQQATTERIAIKVGIAPPDDSCLSIYECASTRISDQAQI
jgi:hypothetical protein